VTVFLKFPLKSSKAIVDAVIESAATLRASSSRNFVAPFSLNLLGRLHIIIHHAARIMNSGREGRVRLLIEKMFANPMRRASISQTNVALAPLPGSKILAAKRTCRFGLPAASNKSGETLLRLNPLRRRYGAQQRRGRALPPTSRRQCRESASHLRALPDSPPTHRCLR
jgi:hypothetical protein